MSISLVANFLKLGSWWLNIMEGINMFISTVLIAIDSITLIRSRTTNPIVIKSLWQKRFDQSAVCSASVISYQDINRWFTAMKLKATAKINDYNAFDPGFIKCSIDTYFSAFRLPVKSINILYQIPVSLYILYHSFIFFY